MLMRTLKGLSLSILIGILAAAVSAVIALVLGVASATLGKTVDSVITFVIDLVMGIPHMLLLILISVAMGKGLTGVIVGVALSHWPSLARLIRAEVIQLKESPYIQISERLGKSKWYIVKKHMLPHLLPQLIVGLILLFPHAILHESSITFLGFGLSTEQRRSGSCSRNHAVSCHGKMVACPVSRIFLVATVAVFYVMGQSVRKLIDPGSVHE